MINNLKKEIIRNVEICKKRNIGIYVSDYYRALTEALAVLGQDKDGVTVTETKNEKVVFAPENLQAGL